MNTTKLTEKNVEENLQDVGLNNEVLGLTLKVGAIKGKDDKNLKFSSILKTLALGKTLLRG